MTTQEANNYFAAVIDRSAYEIGVDISGLESVLPGGDGDVWPEAMTSATRLTGMLPYCHGEDELVEAVRQFALMLQSGRTSMEEWEDDLLEVVAELFFASQREDQVTAEVSA